MERVLLAGLQSVGPADRHRLVEPRQDAREQRLAVGPLVVGDDVMARDVLVGVRERAADGRRGDGRQVAVVGRARAADDLAAATRSARERRRARATATAATTRAG